MAHFVFPGRILRRLVKFWADLRTPFATKGGNWERKNFWLRLAGLDIAGKGVAIGSGFRCLDGHEENIVICDYANIGHHVHLWNFDRIVIGRFSMIAADVIITNGWHDRNTLEPASGPTSIGNGCWIGSGAQIIGSIAIGDNAIVGAGSVVIRDVAPGSIVAGVPARVIGHRELPERVWHLDDVRFSPQTFEPVPGVH